MYFSPDFTIEEKQNLIPVTISGVLFGIMGYLDFTIISDKEPIFRVFGNLIGMQISLLPLDYGIIISLKY
ncbi:MAG: hypothetical protein JXL97_19670 [Bacteroidales bacterium]|nr:hypothetical protein [Bacteroidales bacterium]